MPDIYDEAISVFGHRNRYIKMAEESAELSVAAHHFADGKIASSALGEEIAACEMLCVQMRRMLGDKLIDDAKTEQLYKLRQAINVRIAK